MMKPTKKKVANSDGKKSDKIDKYFTSAPKPFVIEKIGDPGTSKTFYVQALNEILENNVVDTAPTSNAVEEVDFNDGASALVLEDRAHVSDKKCGECVGKDKQLLDWESKYKALQKVYLTQCHHFSELSIKHNILLSMKSDISEPTNVPSDDIFSPIELKLLTNMSLDKKKDSTFIHQCLEYAYKEDLSLFSSRTLKGVPESVKFSAEGEEIYVPKKDPLTPEKGDRIKQLFIERLIKCKIDSASFESCAKNSNINKIFASCINNIANKNN